MKVKLCSCLLVLVLGSNVTSEIIHAVIREKQQVTLRCSHSVEGKVTWSRETDGNRVDIFTIDGDKEIRHNDPGKRYNSQTDKALHIIRTVLSDSGKYFCNNEPAVELTVIPSGTEILIASAGSSVSLRCAPDPAAPTWTREAKGKNTTVFSQDKEQEQTRVQTRLHFSPVNKTLAVTDLQPDDAGLYYCGGKAAQYLTVTKREGSETDSVNVKSNSQHLALVLGVLLPLIVIMFIILFFTWRWRIKRRGRGEQWNTVYAEKVDGSTFDLLQGGLNQYNPIYSIIHDPPPVGSVSQMNDTTYTLLDTLEKHQHN